MKVNIKCGDVQPAHQIIQNIIAQDKPVTQEAYRLGLDVLQNPQTGQQAFAEMVRNASTNEERQALTLAFQQGVEETTSAWRSQNQNNAPSAGGGVILHGSPAPPPPAAPPGDLVNPWPGFRK